MVKRGKKGRRKVGRPGGTAMQTQQVAFRFTGDLVERLDAFAKQIEAERPGTNITRAEAVRVLLLRALEQEEKKRR